MIHVTRRRLPSTTNLTSGKEGEPEDRQHKMDTIMAFLTRQLEEKKFYRTMGIIALLMVIFFGTMYLRNTNPLQSERVTPGQSGALTFSHYIYGGFGEDGLQKPMFATFGNGQIYVSDTDNARVQVFSESGELITAFGERGDGDGQFYFPYGMVVAPDGKVYVADLYRHDIQIFSAQGDFIGYFAKEHQEQGYLDGPAMMHLTKDGRLFVANVETSEIVVFDLQSEELLQTIGMYGDLYAPNAVTVDDDGYIYVVDTGNQRIVVYSPDGSRPVRIINGSEDGRGQTPLSNPRGIAVRGDEIFVISNLTHSVHVFDKSGKELYSFGELGEQQNQFMFPNGLSIDSRDQFFVTDSLGGRIAVYR